MSHPSRKVLNLPAIKRFPGYLHILKRLNEQGEEYVSTSTLISELELEPVTVRKDLALLGLAGKPRVGYKLSELLPAMEKYLGWNRLDEAFLIGAGSLGSALMGYEQFEENGLKIVAAFDVNPDKVGMEIHGKEVFHISKLKDLANRMGVRLAVVCVPWQNAQVVADLLVSYGFKGIWNFTTVKLKVPPDVVSHNENLSSGLAVFSVKLKKMQELNQ